MSSPFTFSFLPSSDEKETHQEPVSKNNRLHQDAQGEELKFVWLEDLESQFHDSFRKDFPHDVIPLSHAETDRDVSIRRVRESSSSSSSQFQNSGTDESTIHFF